MKIGDLVKRAYSTENHEEAKQKVGVIVKEHYCEQSRRQSYLVQWAPYMSWRDQGWLYHFGLEVVSEGQKKPKKS